MSLLLPIIACLIYALPADPPGVGKFSGSIESNTVRYFNDNWGSNNYLKLGWQKDSLSAGLQAEWYPEALAGYPSELKGVGLTGLWINWLHGPWDLTGGSFYEQLGSGMVLRSWEDRDLGINNCITGARAAFRSGRFNATLLGGLPKSGLWPTLSSFVGGADTGFELIPEGSGQSLRLEASAVVRSALRKDSSIELLANEGGFVNPQQVLTWSGRVKYSLGNFSLKAEYAGKTPEFYAEQLPKSREHYVLKGGNAQLLEMNYAAGGFSGSLTLRRLENIGSGAGRLNYLPSLCMQQTYMLAGLNPYTTLADGEAGLQGDIYYTFRRGSALGGRYGMKLHIGGCWIEGLPCALPDRSASHLAYRDINIELERRWTRNFRTILFVSIQENSPTHGNCKATDAQNVFVFDGLYRISHSTSVKLELQYLYSQELTRDWMAALLELSFAPHWSVTVSDMYNHGSTGIHYYNATVSYSLSSLNISLLAGRNREGLICSGGVCRWQPAWSGAGLRIQWSF
ncbi:MAG: hypothetical protein J6O51_03190 [Bacteroidales bacterium]|nr:hypothetical protein [Bacteroidales bacterium]